MQLGVSIAGAAIGFAFGGPAGAQWGWMAGSMLGSVLFPAHMEGPHMADLKVQNSAYGQPIPIAYGMYRMAGNVIWAAPPVEHSQTSDGKGGPSVTTHSYSESFAVGLCEGPIVGVRRIWANAKLIYDMSSDATPSSITASAQVASMIRVYVGDEFQGPDPTMESDLGVGNVPGYRGLAYVVFTDLDLSGYGNFLPTLSFEVVTASAQTWSHQVLATWSHPTSLGTFFSAPCLNTSVVNALAWGYYYGYEGVHLQTLTAYGSTPNGVWTMGSPGDFPVRGRSDVPGAFVRGDLGNYTMVWLDGQSGEITDSQIPFLPYAGSAATFIKEGAVIWATYCDFDSGYGIYRSNMVGPVMTQSTQTGQWSLLGVTASYLYAADVATGDILKFDKNTLALVGTAFSGAPHGLVLGHVLSDGLMYGAVNGVGVWKFDIVSGIQTRVFDFPSLITPHAMEVVNESTVLYINALSIDQISLSVAHASLDKQGVALSSIVSDICKRVGLQASQIDVSQLTDTVYGYALTGRSAAKSNLQPLMAAYMLDASDTHAKLKFVKRGGSSCVTIPSADLGASNTSGSEEAVNPLISVRTQETDLPQLVEITYLGAQNDYENGTQRAFRAVTTSVQKSALQLPVVLMDDEARQRCELMLWSQWICRTSYTFATTYAYLKYEPSDVVTLIDPDSGYEVVVRLTKCENTGLGQLRWTAVSEDPTLYDLNVTTVGGSAEGYKPPVLSYAGPTKLVVIDMPPLRDVDGSQALYIGACGYDSTWPGAAIQLSHDGVTFVPLVTLTKQTTVGFTQGVLPAFAGPNMPDEASSLTVKLVSGTLSGTDNNGLIAGVNFALIGQELVFFRDAILTGTGTYKLTGFLRARQGTEWAMVSHTSSDVFVLLSASTLYKVPLQIADLGATIKFMPTTLGQMTSIASAVSVTVSEACVRPLAPSGFTAVAGSSDATGDITLSWTRRARVHAGWLNGTDVPLDESAETYQLVVRKGNVLMRTTTVSAAQSWIYSAASMDADGFTVGQTIGFSIAQNSDQGVLGHAATTTIQR